MAWVERGGGSFVKWGEVAVGYTIEGTYLGNKPGEFGPIGEVLTSDGSRAFGMNSVLQDRFKGVEAGDAVKIVYQGMVKTKKGKDAHFFKVFSDQPDMAEAMGN